MAPTMETTADLGRYELYKTGTRKIVDWLTQNASRCIDISPYITTAKSKTSPKIKARALISLAQAIVSAHRPSEYPPTGVVVTSTIVELLHDVIEGRQASADWYAMQPASVETVKMNENHVYFIEILQKVHDLLAPVQQLTKSGPQKKKKATSEKAPHQKPGHELQNLFSQLALEEPSQSPLGNTPSPVSNSKALKTSIVLEDSNENMAFALWCHLEDLRDIRHFVERVWQEYSTGDVSILAATMVTETAFGLMRVSDERFVSIYKEFGDWWFLPKFLSFQAEHCGRLTYLYPTHGANDTANSAPGKDLNDLICPSAYFLLRDVEKKVQVSVQELELNPRPYAWLQSSSQCYNFGDILGGNADELAKILVDLRCQEKPPISAPNQMDRVEFTHGLLDFIRSGKASIWLVCACQLYSCIYEVIGSNPHFASEAYLTSMDEMEAQVDRWRGQQELPNNSPWLTRLLATFKYRHTIEETMRVTKSGMHFAQKTDLDHRMLARHAGVNDFDKDIDALVGKPLRSLQGMPCTAGLLLYQAKLGAHETSVRFSNQHAVILAIAHLYTAARKYGLVKGTWRDLELVLAQHRDANRPLVPKSSKAADAFTPLRHYLLSLGVPAAEFSRGRIPKLPKAKDIQNNARQITVTSPYMVALLEAIKSANKLGFARGHMTENILNKLTTGSDRSSTQHIGSRGSKQHSLLELLTTFKASIVKDEPYLHFDYFTLFCVCSIFLGEVAQMLDPIPTGSEGEKRTFEPWANVHRLLEDATTADSQDKPIASTTMGTAAQMLESFIAANGNKLTHQAFKQSSGRIPKSMRPTFVSDDRAVLNPPSIPGCHMSIGASGSNLYDANGSAERFEQLKQAASALSSKILEAAVGPTAPSLKRAQGDAAS